MATRIESNAIVILCTDTYDTYSKYKISSQYSTSKAETSLVKSKNSLIQHYLARFNRRTKQYSKAFDMIENSLI